MNFTPFEGPIPYLVVFIVALFLILLILSISFS